MSSNPRNASSVSGSGRKVGSGDIELSEGNSARERPLLGYVHSATDMISDIHQMPSSSVCSSTSLDATPENDANHDDGEDFDATYGDMMKRASSIVTEYAATAKSGAMSVKDSVVGNRSRKNSVLSVVGEAAKASCSKELQFMTFVFCFYAFSDAAKIILSSLTMKDCLVNSQTLVVIVSVISIVFGFGLCLAVHGAKRTSQLCFDKARLIEALPPSFCFAVSQAFNIMAYAFLDGPGAGKVISQLKIPIMCFGARFFVKKTYTKNQWYAGFLIALAAILFIQIKEMASGLKGGEGGGTSTSQQVGIFFACMFIIFSCAGTLLSERIFKKDLHIPFYVQKFHIEASQLILAFILIWILPIVGHGVDWFVVNVQHKKSLNVAAKQNISTYKIKFQCLVDQDAAYAKMMKEVKGIYEYRSPMIEKYEKEVNLVRKLKEGESADDAAVLKKDKSALANLEYDAYLSMVKPDAYRNADKAGSWMAYDERGELEHVEKLAELSNAVAKAKKVAMNSPFNKKLYLVS